MLIISVIYSTSKSIGWWLRFRQVDSGGLNGRPEKQCDLCYSWWTLSAMKMLGNRHVTPIQ